MQKITKEQGKLEMELNYLRTKVSVCMTGESALENEKLSCWSVVKNKPKHKQTKIWQPVIKKLIQNEIYETSSTLNSLPDIWFGTTLIIKRN